MAKPGTPVISIVYRSIGGGHSSFLCTHVYERGNSYWFYDMDSENGESPPGLVAVVPIEATMSVYSPAGIIRGMPPGGQYQPRSKANKPPEAE
jgi:hypothetical protein